MEITDRAKFILTRLRDGGHEAYAVGGCVRDSLMGTVPGDWDICTSARPEETAACFPDCRVIETGLKHGTVTVLYEGESFEVTTFRRDGAYSDHRRPERVEFVSGLEEDLRRRDFTVNAMAMGLDGALHDPFGGRDDLAAGIIRCVGNPDRRFGEDALRILRAMRFAARLSFSVDRDTARSMLENRALLQTISPERVFKELTGILTGPGAPEVLNAFEAVVLEVLPEVGPAMGFDQRNPYHDKDVWGHTLEALRNGQPDPAVRWALLLHDLGKPDCFTLDSQGVGHFYGHPRRSEEIARDILTRLRTDRVTLETVCTLVRHHEDSCPVDRVHVRRWIGKFGPELLRKLLEVKRADCLAHVDAPGSRARYAAISAFRELTEQVLSEETCFTVKDLAVSGRDMLAAGVPAGPRVGAILSALLEDVTEDRCANCREALLTRAERYKEDFHAD